MPAVAAWYHCSVKTVGRSAGRSVVAAAAYRLGDRLHEEEIDHTHDYRRRHGVVATFTVAPADAPAWAHDPERLWNAANAAEKRKNSTLAREIELALPSSVGPDVREDIVRSMAAELVERYGVAVSVGIHAPSEHGDQRNHHAHILFTTRRMEADGLGAKTRVLDDRKTGPDEVSHLRAYACDLINAALEDAGSDERVDHRSFAARGIDDEPTQHLGPGASAKERRREESERGALNADIATGNQTLDTLVEELATLDAEIAAEEERQLDARYGAPEEEAAPRDDFATVHGETIAQATADPGLTLFLPNAPVLEGQEFEAVHNQTIAQANADTAVVASEEARAPGSRFERVRAWWGNMRETFAEWRDHLQERIADYRSRWSQEPTPPAPQEIEPD